MMVSILGQKAGMVEQEELEAGRGAAEMPGALTTVAVAVVGRSAAAWGDEMADTAVEVDWLPVVSSEVV